MVKVPRLQPGRSAQGEALATQYGNAIEAVRWAALVMGQIAPYHPGYYLPGQDEGRAMREAQRDRLWRLEAVAVELEVIYQGLFEQLSAARPPLPPGFSVAPQGRRRRRALPPA
jgi:hypothetical protein